jgi:hypothetical protein
MHKPPRNPYEPSVRERLVQRDTALRIQAYVATGKQKYSVYKPLDLAAKREINAFFGASNVGYSSIQNYQSVGRAVRGKSKVFVIDYETWTTRKVEEKWLTERQATMLRLKGYVVEDT